MEGAFALQFSIRQNFGSLHLYCTMLADWFFSYSVHSTDIFIKIHACAGSEGNTKAKFTATPMHIIYREIVKVFNNSDIDGRAILDWFILIWIVLGKIGTFPLGQWILFISGTDSVRQYFPVPFRSLAILLSRLLRPTETEQKSKLVPTTVLIWCLDLIHEWHASIAAPLAYCALIWYFFYLMLVYNFRRVIFFNKSIFFIAAQNYFNSSIMSLSTIESMRLNIEAK